MINHKAVTSTNKALLSPLYSLKLSGPGGLANCLGSVHRLPSSPYLTWKVKLINHSLLKYKFRKFSCIFPHLHHRSQQRASKTSGWSAQALCGTALHTLLHGHPSPGGVCWHGFRSHGTLQCSDIRKVQKCSMVRENHKSRALEVSLLWERKHWMFPPVLKADTKKRDVKNRDPALGRMILGGKV